MSKEEPTKFERAVRQNDRAEMFEIVVNETIKAGFGGADPYF